MRIIFLAALTLLSQSCASANKVNSPEISYDVDGTIHKGYLAAPQTAGKKPGILIVHEWWGHNSYARTRADQLAAQGYVALALDMYGDGKSANHPKDAGELSGKVMGNPELMEKKFRAALSILEKRSDVDTTKIAAIGYCFGGAVVLEMAKKGLPLKSVVSVHGMLSTPSKAQPGKSKTKILVLNGEKDTFISAKQIEDLKKELQNAKFDFEFINIPNAKHGFSNPQATENGKKFSIPIEYNREADMTAWTKSSEFLKSTLQ